MARLTKLELETVIAALGYVERAHLYQGEPDNKRGQARAEKKIAALESGLEKLRDSMAGRQPKTNGEPIQDENRFEQISQVSRETLNTEKNLTAKPPRKIKLNDRIKAVKDAWKKVDDMDPTTSMFRRVAIVANETGEYTKDIHKLNQGKNPND